MKRFALIGNPNSGKTTLFNSLTGSTAHVGNWPGVTVDKKEGIYRVDDAQVAIVDLPGIYSLSPYTPEEVVSRNYILDEMPDCVINIVDATNIERNLYLTTQLLEMDVPVIVALNMMDEVKKNGDIINIEKIEQKLGIPVVEISALKENNLDVLVKKALECSNQKRNSITFIKNEIILSLANSLKKKLESKGISNPLFHAIKLIENDEVELSHNDDSLIQEVNKYKESFHDDTFGNDFEAMIANERYEFLSSIIEKYLEKGSQEEITRADKIDKVLTNKWLGIPIFLVILFAIFHLTFSEDFLYLNSLFGLDIVSFKGTAFEGLLANGGINSPGIILFNLVEILTGTLSSLLSDLFVSSPAWVGGFVVDGIFGGIFAVLSFLPQILCLFLLFSILEDTGYMARVAFILDKIFRKFGLSGRAFMPLIMGFGCSVPAMINTRTLADQNERIATIRIIPFFSCGAKLPILTAIAGGMVMLFNVPNADVITYSMYLIGIIVAIIAVIIMRNTSMRGDNTPFIMELPSYRLPKFSSLMFLLWDKMKHFIIKAFTIILTSTIIIWVISHFSFSFVFLKDEEMNKSILASIGSFLQPIFTPLGFGSQLNSEYGWVFVVAAITGLIAKENVVATFGTIAACIAAGFSGDEEGVAATAIMISTTGITAPALISFIAFNMTTIPCFAAVATAKAELPKGKFLTTIIFWLITSFLVGAMIYLIGTWLWTTFIFVVLIAIAILFVIRYNSAIVNK